MRAAVLAAPKTPLTIEEVEVADPAPSQVLVRMLASGVCHSDYTLRAGELMLPVHPPHGLVLGHEGVGVVEAVGSAVRSVRIGDQVVLGMPTCGQCFYCVQPQPELCESYRGAWPEVFTRSSGDRIPGMGGLGTFAEMPVVEEASVVKVLTTLPPEQVALVGCGVITGAGAALNTAGVHPGSSIAVFGCGGVGLAALQGAKIAGATNLIAIDPVASKRALAERLGATTVVNPKEHDPVEVIRELTSGRGADYVFDAAGIVTTMRQAWDATRRGGTTVLIGVPPSDDEITFPAPMLVIGAKRIVGSFFGSGNVRRDFQRYLDFAEAGQLDLASLITATIDLSDVNEALDAIGTGSAVRSVIVY